MALYPKSVPFDETDLTKLTKTYQEAFVTIYNEIEGATAFGAANRRAILAQIDAVLVELNVDTQEFIKTTIPKYYKDGATAAVAQLQQIFVPVGIKTGYNRLHNEAINALVDDTAKSFGDSMATVKRNTRRAMTDAVKETITQKLATGTIGGATTRQIQRNLIATLRENGFDALVDKAGRGWTLDRYTEMLIRTKAVEARNTGLLNRLVENNVDLVVVSQHGAKDACGPWEGKILSVTGQTGGYPTILNATNAGLFHPNCKHAVSALNLELARQTMAWDPRNRVYGKGLIDQVAY